MGIKRVITKHDLGTKKDFGWGLAYWDYMKMEGYLYPIPINYVVWFFREFYYRLTETPRGIKEKAYNQGYSDGVYNTYKIRKADIEKEEFKKWKREFIQNWVSELQDIWCDDDC